MEFLSYDEMKIGQIVYVYNTLGVISKSTSVYEITDMVESQISLLCHQVHLRNIIDDESYTVIFYPNSKVRLFFDVINLQKYKNFYTELFFT
jgi:hypothetical protein